MPRINALGISVDRLAPTPIFEQICADIRKRILSARLPVGAELPATRALATELGVSRSTVVTAYDQLVAEGYLIGRPRSGYQVCDLGGQDLSTGQTYLKRDVPSDTSHQPAPFEAIHPDPRVFPHHQWAKAVSRVCRNKPETMLFGGTPRGNRDLRQAIVAHIAEWRGIDATYEQVFITAGSTDALEICLRTLSNAGDLIGLENPGYLPLRAFSKAQNLVPNYLNVDEQGACLPQSEPAAKLVVLTPSHQYPLGGAMSAERRRDFTNWAQSSNSWILEDDYDSEFRYAGHPIPAMTGFGNQNRTVYIGSFSKIFSNALRIGYIVAPLRICDALERTFQTYGLKASLMPQQALADFMFEGEFYRHLRRVRRIYNERRRFLMDRLRSDFSDYGWFQDHQAGMHIVFELRPAFCDIEIAKAAAGLGVLTQPLSQLSEGSSGQNGLILGFCGHEETELNQALDHLLFVLNADLLNS